MASAGELDRVDDGVQRIRGRNQRGAQVSEVLKRACVRHVFRTELTSLSRFAAGTLDCLLVNTTGELRFFYQTADLVFVGKSLTAEGGQNPIEPAALGKAVVVGPHMQNFPEIMPRFIAGQGIMQVKNAAELEKAFEQLLDSPERRAELGERARDVVEENQGSIGRTADFIVAELNSRA